MRQKIYLILLALCAMVLVPERAQANDFLEKSDHYSAYASGVNKIHFKIPLFSESEAGFSYFVSSIEGKWDSYIYYDVTGTNAQNSVPICYIKSHRDLADEYDSYNYGTADVKMISGRGVVEITNIHGGNRKMVADDGQWHLSFVKKCEEDDNGDDNVTWLEIDWYPQEALAEKTINVGVHVNLSRFYSPNDKEYTKDFHLAYGLSGGENMIQAQLSQPYFYAVNEEGLTGYGNAAVPYTVFYEPTQYTTSLDPEPIIITERAGNIIVPTTDTVQDFYATFKVYRSKKPDVMSTQVTTKQKIKPYHRIYDFTVTEETDKTGTYTGNNVLEWHIKNPMSKDLVAGDYFEVQRATQPDFSDAKQLDVISMTCSDTSHTYRYVDKSREMWTGNTAQEIAAKSTEIKNYILYDDNGDVYASLNARLYNLDGNQPSVPVYYRVRRASSAIWGWVSDFSKEAKTNKNNYLAPLDSVQPDYTLDPEYETNRKVHFNIHIDNAKVSEFITPSIDKCQLTYNVNWWDTQDSITLNVDLVNIYSYNNYSIEYRVVSSTGIELQPWRYLRDGKQKFLKGSTCEVRINKTTYTYTSSYDESYTTR